VLLGVPTRMIFRCAFCGVLVSGDTKPQERICGRCATESKALAQTRHQAEKDRFDHQERQRKAAEAEGCGRVAGPLLALTGAAAAGAALAWPDPLGLGGAWLARLAQYGLYSLLAFGAAVWVLLLVLWLRRK